MKNLFVIAVGVLLIVHRNGHSADGPGTLATATIPTCIELTNSVELTSFFWPSSPGCCGQPVLSRVDRCHLWDGYCTFGQCLACEPGFVPLRDRWSPSNPCSCQCQGQYQGQCQGGQAGCSLPSNSSPVPAGVAVPTPAPTPAEMPAEIPAQEPSTAPVTPPQDAAPRNVIPTGQRGKPAPHRSPSGESRLVRSGSRSVPSPAPRASATSPVVEVMTEPVAAAVVPAAYTAAAPPLPDMFDYHLPGSLRTALRKTDDSALGQQLRQLSRTVR